MRRSIRGIVPGRLRHSYAAKFGLALAAVILLIGVVGGVVYAQTDEEVRTDTEERLVTTAAIEAGQVDRWVRRMRVRQSARVNDRAFRTDERGEIDSRLVGLVERDRSVRGAYYANVTTGAVYEHHGRGTLTDDGRLTPGVRDRIEELAAEPPNVRVSAVFRARSDGPPVYLFVASVPDDDHRVLVTVVDVERFSETMIEGRNDGRAVVTNESGTVVMARNASLLLTQTDVDPPSDGNASGLFTGTDRRGTEQVVGYAEMSATDWTLMTRMPADEAYALRTAVSRGVLGMVLVAAGGALLVGLTVGRNTVRSVRRLSEKAAALEDGDLDTDLESDRVDEFGRLYDAFAGMRDSLRAEIRRAEEARDEADRRRENSEAFADHLEATADEYGDAMRACAEGDLTRRLHPDDESEAMAAVAREFNAMMDRLESTVADAARFADEVAASSEQLTAGTDDVRVASERVTASIQSISEGADRQHEQFRAVSTEMDDLAASVEQVDASTDDVAETAERTASTGRESREAAETAIDAMAEVDRTSREAVAAMDELREEMTEIEAVVELIADLADQTDMIALNASVEAARNADGSDGYGAVAEEVRSLADDTKAAATEIEERIEAVRTQTEHTAAAVGAAREDAAAGTTAVREVADALDEIATAAEQTNDGVREIRAATSEQAASTEEVVSMVSAAASISEETTAEAETVAAAAEEQTSTLSEVAEGADALADRAERLRAALDRFETSTGTPTAELPAAR